MRTSCLALFLALLYSPTFAASQTTLVNPPVGNDAWIIPSAGGTVLYGATDSTDNYALAQWNNPVSDMGNFGPIGCSGSFAAFTNCFQATSPNIVGTAYTGTDANQWIDFTTTGAGLVCNTEMDSLETAINVVYRNYPQAQLGSAYLNMINHLYVSFKVKPVAFSTIDSSCGTTQNGVYMDVNLHNDSASQQLFFQILLYLYNASYPGRGFFANSNPYGFRDVMGTFNLSELSVGTTYDFTGINEIDVLPGIISAIQGAGNGLDTNIANWYTNAGYHGHNTLGHTLGETQFCCFTLIATSAPRGRPLSWHQ